MKRWMWQVAATLVLAVGLTIAWQYVWDLWNSANPPRDVQMTADVTVEEGVRVLNLYYTPIQSRRCQSQASHYLDKREGDEPTGIVLRRWQVFDHNGGLVPVDQDGHPINQKFELSQDIPRGLAPGVYFHTSTRSTQCEILPGWPRYPVPTWTAPVRVVVPPVVNGTP